MSENTDKKISDNEASLVGFYRDRILPLAELAHERGVEFFPLGGESQKSSYFIDRACEGDYVHSIDIAELRKNLADMWNTEELPELSAIAEPIAELARILHQKESFSDEVSPFIYAMF